MSLLCPFDTDLALERLRADTNLPGIMLREEKIEGMKVSHLHILDDDAASQMGRSKGNYLTIEYPRLFEDVLATPRADVLPRLLSPLLPCASELPLLVIGLGNDAILPDSLGTHVADGIYATLSDRKNGTAVFSPGTEQKSGVSLSAFVSACIASINPRAVIAVDALTTRSSKRLLSTIQITDTGIAPGSGIRNKRTTLSSETLGCPVIAIGIPTVISSHAVITESGATPPSDLPPIYLCPYDSNIGIVRGAAVIAHAVNMLSDMF